MSVQLTGRAYGMTDHERIAELHQGFLEANKTADTAFLRAHMAPGAETLVWDNLNKSIYLGLDHICRLWDFLAYVSKGVPAKVEARDEQIHVVGDLAWVHAVLEFEADFGVMGTVVQPARETEIWQRIDGDWKMVHLHCSGYEAGGWEGGL